MVILFINHDGAGFADHIQIAEGTTVEQLFAQRVPHSKPGDFLMPGRAAITATVRALMRLYGSSGKAG